MVRVRSYRINMSSDRERLAGSYSDFSHLTIVFHAAYPDKWGRSPSSASVGGAEWAQFDRCVQTLGIVCITCGWLTHRAALVWTFRPA